MTFSVYHKVLLIIFIILVTFGALNWPYFEANIRGPIPQTEPKHSLPPNTLNIPSLGIQVPVTYPVSNKESDIQDALISGVAWYPGTALAGQIGNMYIAGHSSDNPWSKGNYKTVFALLPKLELGQEIQITDSAGRFYTYKIIETKIVSPKDFSVLIQPTDRFLLTLQTSYPLGTALKRYIVVSELVK